MAKGLDKQKNEKKKGKTLKEKRAEKRDKKKSKNKKHGNRKKSFSRDSVNIEEVKSRASSGENLSLSDIGALLNSGGLSSIQNGKKEKHQPKKKKKMSSNISPSRGQRGRSKKNY